MTTLTHTQLLTQNLGYPRIGERRELKQATEAYWRGTATAAELEATGRTLRRERWLRQQAAGIDLIPSNDFSFYDHVLDTICLTGAIPARFGWDGGVIDRSTYFLLARGVAPSDRREVPALEMTKWFDTNYHYLVPELRPGMRFSLAATKPFDEFAEAAALGIITKPVLLGPVTFLSLGKVVDDPTGSFDRFDLLNALLPIYVDVLRQLSSLGASWVQVDEPIFALDLDQAQHVALAHAYSVLAEAAPDLRLLVATYFGELRDNLSPLMELPVAAVHVDAVRGSAELDTIVAQLPQDKVLSVGIVDGRNVWIDDLDRSLHLLDQVRSRLGSERLMLAPSCSLLHVPITVSNETALDDELTGWLAFADEKLVEVRLLADALRGERDEPVFACRRHIVAARRASDRVRDTAVRQRMAAVGADDDQHRAPFAERQGLQQTRLGLPLLPTTVIGSFPQTEQVRALRARWKQGRLTTEEYTAALEREIDRTIALQEAAGLDVLAHGEFERNDMVEYFGEQLDGVVCTQHGWVQSYGSRYVKPPIIFGDVGRPRPMTIRWSQYAQSRTARPIKGMLTGPVTLAKWSFVRDDQRYRDTVLQLALAVRDEVVDLEGAGLHLVQIDEPALREGMPLRHADWDDYLDWAARMFRLASSGAGAATQIHTHMCYGEFNAILPALVALDADVISIEAARSNMELLDALVRYRYPNAIGPGVYDIHSPHIPTVEDMLRLLRHASTLLPVRNLWVNPDCGLKTRRWEEVIPALQNMVQAAQQLRQEHEQQRLEPASDTTKQAQAR